MSSSPDTVSQDGKTALELAEQFVRDVAKKTAIRHLFTQQRPVRPRMLSPTHTDPSLFYPATADLPPACALSPSLLPLSQRIEPLKHRVPSGASSGIFGLIRPMYFPPGAAAAASGFCAAAARGGGGSTGPAAAEG